MARITRISSERVHGWFRLLTETLGRRKHFAVSFLNASHETTRAAMEEVVILDDPPAPSTSVAPTNGEVVTGSTHLPQGQTPYTISVTVVRGNQGFGFSVAWTKPPRVERVEEGLPADQAGLRPGDYIIFVSHYNVVKFEEDAVLEIIKECGDRLPLEVYRRGVSKPPRGLPNGYTTRPPITENESHPRKRLSHITFNTESAPADRQTVIFALINCEQAFSHACRFGLERYLIPLKFRADLITQSQHQALFNNMDQLMDLSETLVDRLMGGEDDTIGDQVGRAYYHLIEELAEHYDTYLGGLPEADKVLSLKLHDMDFKDFLLAPTVPRKKPDITDFIHKPAEHLREVLGMLTQVYTCSPGHHDNTYLDTVLHRLKSCYRGMTSQQNIMEPSPSTPLPGGPPGMTPSPSLVRSQVTLRPPLVSVSDIEQRLVFTKFTQPFRLNDAWRQWVFGGELYKFEGRHLKQYWVMLFTDLLLFTKINRDRVIFVMEDPVPLTSVCQALFTIKKKATEFRLIVDTRVRVSGAGSGYLTTPRSQRPTSKTAAAAAAAAAAGSGRSHKKTMVLRAPSVDLKATWNNLIHRQLYICQQQQQQQQQQLGSPHHHASSIARAVSTDGLHSLPLATGRFSSSVGDLRRGGRQEEEEVVLDLGDERPRGSTSSLFKSSKVRLRCGGECEEEIDLHLEDEQAQAPPPSASATSQAPVATTSRVSHRRGVEPPGEVQLIIQDEDPGGSSSRRVRSYRSSKVRRGGKAEEEIVLNLDDEDPQTAPLYARSSRVNSALLNDSQRPVPNVVVDQNVENAARDSTDYCCDEEVDDCIVIQDERTGIQTRIDPKKGKGIGGKVKDKLFPNRHLPKKKKMNRVKKVEKFVDSIVVEDLNHHGRVTPVFKDEEELTHDDFAQKRIDILQNRPRNFIEGEEEVITLDDPVPSTSHLSPMRAELMMAEERRKLAMKKKEEKRIAMRLEGIEEESLERIPSQDPEEHRKTILSPEDYEDYIGDAVEKDYPELAGGLDAPTSQQLNHHDEKLPYEESQEFEQKQLIEQQKQLIEEQKQVIEEQQQWQQQQDQAQQQQQQQQQQPTGPLSGSASMNFMDDHSPTSNGTAEGRGLKRYGSSCDIAKLMNTTEEPIYAHDDDPNGNFEFGVRKSKIGGTGSGPFVAGKLAVFEKVAEEEHQKFIECQEVRKRIFRAPKKSGEYIEKFYSPKVIETIDVRATEKSRSLRYYDDEYDSHDNPRSPTPTELKTPYGGRSSPYIPSSNFSSQPSCSSLHSSTIYDPPRSPTPTQEYRAPSYTYDDFDTYDFVGRRQRSPTPISDDRTGTRQCSPVPESTEDTDFTYSRIDAFKDANCLETTISGPSRSPLPDTKDNLEQRTDEVLEMLDNSFLDTLPEEDDPSHYITANNKSYDEGAVGGADAGCSASYSGYEGSEYPTRTASPMPEPDRLPEPDPLDEVFDIEDYDSQGSTTSLRGGHKRTAAPPPPPPVEAGTSASSSSTDNKRGGFFGRARKDKDKDKDKEKKDKEKKDKDREKREKKEREKERKEREKRDKDKDKDKAAGKRFQLFGGAKKASEPNTAEETSDRPSKKDKGKRRLFGRGKENFIGCSPHISHESDPQVARMAGDSFDQESVDLQEDTEFL